MSNLEEKLDKVITELDNLHQKIDFMEKLLEQAKSDRRIPRNPWDVIVPGLPPVPTYEYKRACTQCGIDFGDGPIGYSCPEKNCPCGLGSPWSGVPTL